MYDEEEMEMEMEEEKVIGDHQNVIENHNYYEFSILF